MLISGSTTGQTLAGQDHVAGGTLRYLAILLIALTTVRGCSDTGTNPQPVTIKDGMRYFPVQQGNKWFYNSGQYSRLSER